VIPDRRGTVSDVAPEGQTPALSSAQEAVRAQAKRLYRRMMRRVWIALGTVFLLLMAMAWATDFITAKGERTVYTASCQGMWKGDDCVGTLVAGERIRFRALRAHQEVLFWTVGGAEPAGKLSPCVIEDGRDWSCKAGADSAHSIALAMVHGQPQPGAQAGRPFHEVSKLRWLLLRYGDGWK
jgi:hypothetical protein